MKKILILALLALCSLPAGAQTNADVLEVTWTTTAKTIDTATARSKTSGFTLFPVATVVYCGGAGTTNTTNKAFTICTTGCQVTTAITINMPGSAFSCRVASSTATMHVLTVKP